MLDKQAFLKGMQQLGLYYKNFSLNEKESSIWYLAFRDMSEQQFKETLVKFMKSSIYSPNNPTQIINPNGARYETVPKWLQDQMNGKKYIDHQPTGNELKELEETRKLIESIK